MLDDQDDRTKEIRIDEARRRHEQPTAQGSVIAFLGHGGSQLVPASLSSRYRCLMSKSADTLFRRLVRAFASAQDDVRARQMERYMRGAFTFYGIPAPTQLRIAREAVEGLPSPNEAELRSTSIACWKRTQREWQYFGCWYLRRNIGAASPAFLTTAERLVTTRSWWDTVDSLAVHVV
jgi:hypothetical protein